MSQTLQALPLLLNFAMLVGLLATVLVALVAFVAKAILQLELGMWRGYADRKGDGYGFGDAAGGGGPAPGLG